MNILSPDNLLVLIELEALITERAGMEADNVQRIANGYSIAYDSMAFAQLQDRILALRARVKVEVPQ